MVQLDAVPQWRVALDRANEARAHQLEARRRLKAREVSLAEVLADPVCESMKVGTLLLSLPAVGPVKRDRILRRVAVLPTRALGELSERQRSWLVEAVS